MEGEQDMTKMGGLKKYLPWTHWTFVCGWLAIIGTPFFSGFFSKDEILWMSFHSPYGSRALWLVAVVAAGCTAFYMTRLMAMTFWGASRVPKNVHPHESPPSMLIPLCVLAFLSVFAGWLGVPHGLSTILPGHPHNILEHWLEHVIRPIPGMEEGGDISMEMLLMVVSVAFAAVSAFLAFYLYVVKPKLVGGLVSAIRPIYSLVYNKYWVDEIYQAILINPLIVASRQLWTKADVGLIDKTTYKLTDFIRSAGEGFRSSQTGQLQTYSLMIVIGVIVSVVLLMT
jgi:NADH-quinone oxidoreductase subunit L